MNYNGLPSKSNKQWRRNGFSKIWELRSGSIGVMCSCVSQEMKFGMLQLAILFVFVESLAYNFWNNTNKVLPILLQIDHSFKRWLLLIMILGGVQTNSLQYYWHKSMFCNSLETLITWNFLIEKICIFIVWWFFILPNINYCYLYRNN